MSYSLGGHLAVLAVHKYSPALRNVWPLVTHSPPQPRWHCNASQQNIEILIFCLTEHSQHFPTCTEHMKCLASHYCKGYCCNVYYSLTDTHCNVELYSHHITSISVWQIGQESADTESGLVVMVSEVLGGAKDNEDSTPEILLIVLLTQSHHHPEKCRTQYLIDYFDSRLQHWLDVGGQER